MASDRARNVLEMDERVLAFDGVHSAEYAAIAAAAVQFARMQASHNAMETFFAEQASGESSMAVEAKSLLKAAARRRMNEFRRTARALRFSIAGIEQEFMMPIHDTDKDVVAKGRDMVDKHATYETEFTNLGCPKARRTELADILDQIEAAGMTKNTAVQETVGATAGIDNEIDEVMEAATILDAIMTNFYRDDPVTLAEWKTARHVKTSSGTPLTQTPPSP